MDHEDAINLRNDRLLDMLGYWIEKIIIDIHETFKKDDQKSIYDDLGDSYIIGNIHIILTLCDRYEAIPYPLTLSEARNWKKSYLDTYDRCIHLYHSDTKFAALRRNAIESLFDELIELISEVMDD